MKKNFPRTNKLYKFYIYMRRMLSYHIFELSEALTERHSNTMQKYFKIVVVFDHEIRQPGKRVTSIPEP